LQSIMCKINRHNTHNETANVLLHAVHNLSKNMVKPFRSFVKEKGGYCQNF
jgi:hypothetical protein